MLILIVLRESKKYRNEWDEEITGQHFYVGLVYLMNDNITVLIYLLIIK